jgi:hypothetical protein
MRGKVATVIDQIEHGHHVFRASFKSAVLRQYEKFSTFLRNELCSNNFGLRKGLDHLDAVRQTFQTITSRFAGYRAQWLNVHVDFPLLQRIALPIIGSVHIRESKSMTCASSVCSRFFCTPALTSAVGPPRKSTRPSSPPSISPSELTV